MTGGTIVPSKRQFKCSYEGIRLGVSIRTPRSGPAQRLSPTSTSLWPLQPIPLPNSSIYVSSRTFLQCRPSRPLSPRRPPAASASTVPSAHSGRVHCAIRPPRLRRTVCSLYSASPPWSFPTAPHPASHLPQSRATPRGASPAVGPSTCLSWPWCVRSLPPPP